MKAVIRFSPAPAGWSIRQAMDALARLAGHQDLDTCVARVRADRKEAARACPAK